MRKDFIIDAYQVYESAVWGAHAFLLIAFLLDEKELGKAHNPILNHGRHGFHLLARVLIGVIPLSHVTSDG